MNLLGLIGLCYVAIIVWMYFSQEKKLYAPKRTMTANPSDIGLTHESIWLTTRLNTRIHAWWVPHPAPRCTLLFSHGNGGNLSHRLDSLRIFHDLGLNVLVYDYSGYGRSQGKPSEAATAADARAAWDWLVETGSVRAQDSILFGRSLGGAVTANLAAELAMSGIAPAGLIMESTFTSVPDMGASMYPWLPVRLLARYAYNSLENLSSLRCPGLFLHSPEDETVPYQLGRTLYDSYQGPKTFVNLSGTHNAGFRTSGHRYPDALNAFLDSLKKHIN
ncbi:alpha/beta hydrolase [Pseudodesulfovibrio sp. JC047]|uniref:alpha/beta hydrolase n=1 Tax=Pseudodesulfovibrio sp. JC047 TaxID=2683199 RepID=UPI001EF2F973|nr:alpha/beta hydrolase [Pseudodesulfovibrio sp. JC047]